MAIIQQTVVDPARRAQWIRTTATRCVPLTAIGMLMPIAARSAWQAGDLLLCSVRTLGQIAFVEHVPGKHPMFTTVSLFPGSKLLVALGERAGKSTCVAHVPRTTRRTLHLHAAGGLVGKVVTGSENTELHPLPSTIVDVIARACDREGKQLRTTDFGYRISGGVPKRAKNRPRLILVVGSDMDDGKTHAAKAVIYSLRASGTPVVAGKATGVGRLADITLMRHAGASCVADFVDFGLPTTVGSPLKELRDTFFRLYNLLRKRVTNDGVVVIELADGLLQRETNFLLRDPDVASFVDHVVFASSGALAALKGVELLGEWGHRVTAISGRIGNSPLARQQFSEITRGRFPVFNSKHINNPNDIAALFDARHRD